MEDTVAAVLAMHEDEKDYESWAGSVASLQKKTKNITFFFETIPNFSYNIKVRVKPLEPFTIKERAEALDRSLAIGLSRFGIRKSLIAKAEDDRIHLVLDPAVVAPNPEPLPSVIFEQFGIGVFINGDLSQMTGIPRNNYDFSATNPDENEEIVGGKLPHATGERQITRNMLAEHFPITVLVDGHRCQPGFISNQGLVHILAVLGSTSRSLPLTLEGTSSDVTMHLLNARHEPLILDTTVDLFAEFSIDSYIE